MSRWTGDQREETDWELLARYLSGECSPGEVAIIEGWMKTDPANEHLLRSMETIWNVPEPPAALSDVAKLWSQLAEGAGIPVSSRNDRDRQVPQDPLPQRPWLSGIHTNTHRFLRYAAVLVAGSILTVLVMRDYAGFWQGRGTAEFQTITVANGDRQRLTLADGSHVVLDAGSVLQYPKKFFGHTREVSLNGEGYFDVRSDPDKHFIVHTNHATVQVLGTEFNIRAWQVNEQVVVSVAEGRVRLAPEGGMAQEAVIIDKGQSSTMAKDGVPSRPVSSDIEEHIGWMNNKVTFRDIPLREILYQLERWYDVEFVLPDSSVTEERLFIHLQDDPLEQIVDLIATLIDSEYELRDDSVYLLKENQTL
jgi:ferric-dicitrate binding protein FerR (iron transport regulator)